MEEMHPELKDVLEMVNRYNATHNEGCFVFNFVGFKKDPGHKCVDCGDDCDEVDDTKSVIGAFGDIGTLRLLINDLRDVAEDNMDEDCFVNV